MTDTKRSIKSKFGFSNRQMFEANDLRNEIIINNKYFRVILLSHFMLTRGLNLKEALVYESNPKFRKNILEEYLNFLLGHNIEIEVSNDEMRAFAPVAPASARARQLWEHIKQTTQQSSDN